MNPARWRLAGRKALVTGGTRGIGHAVVTELLQLGAEVLVAARNADRLAGCLRAWHESGYATVAGFAADLSTESGVAQLAEKVSADFGQLDILVNNAGTNIRKKTTEYTREEYEHILHTNMTSAWSLTRALYDPLCRAQDASVVLIGSVAGLVHLRTGSPYGMTKAALAQLAKNLAVEWGDDGIRVNTVAPWYINTPLAEQVLQDTAYRDEVLSRTRQAVRRPRRGCRIGEPA